jgi:TolB-like protein/DNA-binding winged helix-turn-helix (wHTH) protein/Flp pilus assembly protein TadD
MMRQAKHFYEFGSFRIDRAERLLLRDSQVVPLTPKVFDTLLVLVENSGHILTKDEVMKMVWPETVVEEANLSKNISTLRKALGESTGQYQYIETIPWRGYRFVASVREVGLESGDLVVEERTRSRVFIEQEQEANPLAVPASLESASIERAFASGSEAKSRSKKSTNRTVLSVCAVLALVVSAIVLALISNKNQPRTGPVITSLAVLPLENLSGDPSQEYFADGMTEALIGNLARIHALRVISRTSVMRFKGSNKLLPEIARQLNVDAVIEGSVRRSGGRVLVSAKLIRAATDSPLWTGNYERELSDVLKLQSEVAREVADEIRIQVTAEERARLASARRVNPEAHEAYLLGQYHNNKGNEQGWKQAIDYFERAIQISPDYGAAYAGLSNAWFYRGTYGAKFKEVESPARAAALKSIELAELLAEAHISLAIVKHYYDWDWTRAEREFRRALELDPGSLQAHISYGHLLMHLGRHDEAIREGQIAVQLDPVSSATQASLGRFLYRARRYEEAVQRLKRAVELEPRSVGANFRLGDLYAQVGRYDEAIAAFGKIEELAPGDFQVGIARVYALMGRHREARHMIRGLKANADTIAAVYAALGDEDEAFRILEKAVEERQLIVVLKVDPPLENLHSDPRWKVLLRRMNLPLE